MGGAWVPAADQLLHSQCRGASQAPASPHCDARLPARLPRRFKVIDTSGLEPFLPSGTIQARATALTAKVLSRSDVTLLLIDGRWVPAEG